ncbi:MAG TPA: preQ(1) synthase [Ktedonobacteraceae bacterium]|jgi:7-cyano-7-deazaguanine reductase|nr:preQ(1) synthase [Ktedonobacteraceae bacterium]
MEPDHFTILGHTVRESKKLEGFSTPAGLSSVNMVSDEVTACCPITNQRDFYTVKIFYVPDAFCLESKSVKLYLASFTNEGIFAEAFAVQIRNDVIEAIHPHSCRVEIIQKPRGGITITAVAGE